MPPPTARRRPFALMWPPAARWSEHLCMLVVRDTRGCELDEHEQLNRFPANPYCCITWMLEGEVQLVAQGASARCEVLPKHFVHGCQTRPCVSRNQGDRHSFCAVFYPDAFHALFGVDLASIQDAFVDVAQVMPDHDWAAHAINAGYADQSHLVRDCKEISGRTPTQIAQQARRDEADWVYRL